MSITDELREFMDGADGYELWCPRHKRELTAIADRIDAEHERVRQMKADEFMMPFINVTNPDGTREGWVLISRDGNGYADTFAFTHHHAPTVEDVLREMLVSAELSGGLCDANALIAEYAAKLRLAEEED